MNPYITGATIKTLREKQHMTQSELAEVLNVSDKTVSKWETGRGYPDITMLEPLATALHGSMAQLFTGKLMENNNRSANMLRSCFYVCPVCGNILHSTGPASISCCGIILPPLEAQPFDEQHQPTLERVEDETFVSISHDMTKQHYISFLAYANGEKMDMVKLYPEGNAETRFKFRGHGWLFAYCNRHGLMKMRV